MSNQDAGSQVVVLGATGNIGTSLVQALSQDPKVSGVMAVARRSAAWSSPKVHGIAADITRDDLASFFDGADVIVDLAWTIQPSHDPVATWRNNVLGSIRVFDAAAEARVPALVYASSVGAYSPGPKDRTVDESWPTHGWPECAYCREKAYLERYLDAFERRNPDIRVARLRPGFVFKEHAAAQQRRLFLGPFLPNGMVRPDLLPGVPDFPGLRFQVVHTDDVAEAYRLAVLKAVSGPFNIAADPIVDAAMLSELFGTRRIPVPRSPVRAALAAAWALHLIPSSPYLFDALMRIPLMDTSRAQTTLDWSPRHTSAEAISAFVRGLQRAQGAPTPPLRARVPGGRVREVLTGVGQRE